MKNEPSIVMKDVSGYLTMDQIERILDQARCLRDKVMFMLTFRCGRRISEVLNVKVKHINKDRDSILFYILKKRVEISKLKAVDSETMVLIRHYVKTESLEPDNWLFPSPYIKGKHLTRQMAFTAFKKMANGAGIFYVGTKEPHPHHLRHSHAINYLDRNDRASALRMLQMQLEHSTIRQTTHYLQFSEKDQRLALNKVFATQDKAGLKS